MTIEKITITGIGHRAVDVTSHSDAFPQSKVLTTTIDAIVTIRNNDAAPLRISTEFEGMVSEKEAKAKLENILFELK